MLNSKVEKCPKCGKIKSKTKACKFCGFESSAEESTWTNALEINEYFVSFVIEDKHGVAFGNITLTNAPKITVYNIASIQRQIKEEINVDKVTIISFVKL